jgi:hypothetical protein
MGKTKGVINDFGLHLYSISVVPVVDLKRLFVIVFFLNFDLITMKINDSDTLNVCCVYFWNQVMLYCEKH